MSDEFNTPNDAPRTIQEVIRTIEEKTPDGDYIYRGERKHYQEVSSSLYREHADIEQEYFDLKVVEKEMLDDAKKHTGQPRQEFVVDFASAMDMTQYASETSEFELLTELQHYGGKTNLIDFTTDYLIAVFFACNGAPEEDGRVIVKETEKMKDIMIRPQNPRHRVIVQKSVFVHPPNGLIELAPDDTVTIRADLKQTLLGHLRKYHGVSTETIYNDIHGFIRNQSIHRNAYAEFYRGLTCQNRGSKAPSVGEGQKEYEKCIAHYDTAIQLNSEFAQAYCNRGEAWMHLGEWRKAKNDLMTARDKGLDIIASFRNDYESVEEFEQKNNMKLPEDMAAMLTPTAD